ncbi:MAG: hypothetical protein HYV47_01645 [Candidatus Nealsonbacteria bacterium]|nr:hypothetical protein [Candidatus Nealsonbacteria bacterium]
MLGRIKIYWTDLGLKIEKLGNLSLAGGKTYVLKEGAQEILIIKVEHSDEVITPEMFLIKQFFHKDDVKICDVFLAQQEEIWR